MLLERLHVPDCGAAEQDAQPRAGAVEKGAQYSGQLG